MLSVQDLCKSYSGPAGERLAIIEGLTFDLHRNETLVLLGRSGSGKSTLLNLLSGTDRPDSGAIRYRFGPDSFDLHTMPDEEATLFRRRHVGFVFQFFNLVPTLTVEENVLLPLQLTGRMHLRDDALNRLAELGLGDRRGFFPEQLSGGEQQRIAVVRALAHEPEVILADEPTGSLDEENGNEVARILRHEVEELGCGMILVTHSADIARLGHRVLELQHHGG